MRVRIKRHLDGTPKVSYADSDSKGRPRLAVECEAFGPPSSKGRRVWVFLDDDEVTALLLELRHAATVARR